MKKILVTLSVLLMLSGCTAGNNSTQYNKVSTTPVLESTGSEIKPAEFSLEYYLNGTEERIIELGHDIKAHFSLVDKVEDGEIVPNEKQIQLLFETPDDNGSYRRISSLITFDKPTEEFPYGGHPNIRIATKDENTVFVDKGYFSFEGRYEYIYKNRSFNLDELLDFAVKDIFPNDPQIPSFEIAYFPDHIELTEIRSPANDQWDQSDPERRENIKIISLDYNLQVTDVSTQKIQ